MATPVVPLANPQQHILRDANTAAGMINKPIVNFGASAGSFNSPVASNPPMTTPTVDKPATTSIKSMTIDKSMAGMAGTDQGGDFYYDQGGTKQYKTPSSSGANASPWINPSTAAFDPNAGQGWNDAQVSSALDFLSKDYSNPDAAKWMQSIVANAHGANTSTTSTVTGQPINFNPTSAQGQFDLQSAVNQENKTYLEKQIATQTAKATQQSQANIGGINAGVGAVNREGIQSQGNQFGAQAIVQSINTDLQIYKDTMANQMRQLQEAQAAGQSELASNISKNIASTQAVMFTKQLQVAQMEQIMSNTEKTKLDTLGANNGLAGLTDDQLMQLSQEKGIDFNTLKSQSIAQTRNQLNTNQINDLNKMKTGFSLVQDQILSGRPIAYEDAARMSQASGLSTDQIMNFNLRAMQIAQDNRLDPLQKQAEYQKIKAEADNAINGIFTNEQKQWAFYNKMQKSGQYTPKELQDYLMINKLDSTNNPLTLLDMQYKNALIQQNYGQMAKIRADLADMGYDVNGNPISSTGGGGGTIPTGPITKVSIGTKQVQGQQVFVDALASADADMFAATGKHLNIVQDYRTNDQQKAIRAKFGYTSDTQASGAGGLPKAAPPGTSFHEKGLAIDVSNWKEASPFLAKYGIVGGVPGDAGHFSMGEMNPDIFKTGGNSYINFLNEELSKGTPPKVAKELALAKAKQASANPEIDRTAGTPLPATLEAIAQGVATYDIDPKSTSVRGKTIGSSERALVLARARELTNGKYDESQYTTRAALKKDYMAGTTKTNITSVNTAINHLAKLDEAGKALATGGWTDLNAAWQGIAGRFSEGDAKLTSFAAAKNAVVDEMAKVFKGSGTSNQSQVEEWKNTINSAKTPEGMRAAIDTGLELMAGRVSAINERYQTTMGEPLNYSIIDPSAEKVLLGMGKSQEWIDELKNVQSSVTESPASSSFSSFVDGLLKKNGVQAVAPSGAADSILSKFNIK